MTCGEISVVPRNGGVPVCSRLKSSVRSWSMTVSTVSVTWVGQAMTLTVTVPQTFGKR